MMSGPRCIALSAVHFFPFLRPWPPELVQQLRPRPRMAVSVLGPLFIMASHRLPPLTRTTMLTLTIPSFFAAAVVQRWLTMVLPSPLPPEYQLLAGPDRMVTLLAVVASIIASPIMSRLRMSMMVVALALLSWLPPMAMLPACLMPSPMQQALISMVITPLIVVALMPWRSPMLTSSLVFPPLQQLD